MRIRCSFFFLRKNILTSLLSVTGCRAPSSPVGSATSLSLAPAPPGLRAHDVCTAPLIAGRALPLWWVAEPSSYKRTFFHRCDPVGRSVGSGPPWTRRSEQVGSGVDQWTTPRRIFLLGGWTRLGGSPELGGPPRLSRAVVVCGVGGDDDTYFKKRKQVVQWSSPARPPRMAP